MRFCSALAPWRSPRLLYVAYPGMLPNGMVALSVREGDEVAAPTTQPSKAQERRAAEVCSNAPGPGQDRALLAKFLRFGFTGWFNFPQLTQAEYEEYTCYDFARYPQHVGLIVLLMPIVVTRVSLYNLGSSSVLWGLGFLFFVFTLVSTHVNFAVLFLQYAAHKSSGLEAEWYQARADWLLGLRGMKILSGGSLEMVFGTLSTALYFVARATAGQCPADATIWASQACNPVASCHSIPHDNVIFLYVYPLLVMCVVHCGNLYAVVVSYVIAAASVFASLILVDAPLQLYSAVDATFFLGLALSIEGGKRSLFLAKKRAEQSSAQRKALLCSVLPERVVDKLAAGEQITTTTHSDVCTFFSDIVRFTELTESLGPERVAVMLGELYAVMDACVDKCKGVWKVETAGDAYFCECGVVSSNGSLESNVSAILDFAVLVHQRVSEILNPLTGEPLELRIGIHCGECAAGLSHANQLMPHFSLFGDVVNMTSRLESTSNPRMVQVSSAVRSAVSADYYVFERRGMVDMKGASVPCILCSCPVSLSLCLCFCL